MTSLLFIDAKLFKYQAIKFERPLSLPLLYSCHSFVMTRMVRLVVEPSTLPRLLAVVPVLLTITKSFKDSH